MPIHTCNDFNMYYEVHGGEHGGDPLLCIMGITGTASVWKDHVEVWSRHHRCITPDNRGVGQSDKPPGDYSASMMADDHAALLDGLGVKRAHVIGCSMGSIIAQQLALRHPDKVKSLVLMCPWARCDAYAKSVFRHMVEAKAHLTPAAFIEWIQLLIFHKRSWDDPEMHAAMLEGRETAATDPCPQPLHGLVGQAAACVNHQALDQLPRITAPAWVVGGEDDIFTPRWMAEEIHAALPNSTLHLFPESGHAFHWENLEAFNQGVLDFVRTHAAGR